MHKPTTATGKHAKTGIYHLRVHLACGKDVGANQRPPPDGLRHLCHRRPINADVADLQPWTRQRASFTSCHISKGQHYAVSDTSDCDSQSLFA